MSIPKLPVKLAVPLQVLVGAVWVFHGLYSKLLGGIPRHRMIVERVLGDGMADYATIAIGLAEVFLGLWAWSGRYKRVCAAVQTVAIIAMNTLEILLARELLISATGMVALNSLFIGGIWWWATANRIPRSKAEAEITAASLPAKDRML